MTLHGPLKDFFFSANEMSKNIEIFKIPDIYKLELGKFMHRAQSGNLPPNFENYFTRIENMHNYSLRSIKKNTFYSKSVAIAKYKSWLTNAGVDLWKTISSELKDLPLKPFARKYKQQILNDY